MAKYRVHIKNASVTVKSRLAHNEQINERELHFLMQNTITGLFSVTYDGKRQLVYQAPCTVSLKKYLKGNLLHENAFWRMISQMIDAAIEVQSNGLYTAHLLLQKDALFIKEDTLEMFFIYQPIVSTKLSENLFALIHDIVYQEIKKEGGMQQTYLIDFQNFLLQGNYHLGRVRRYIDEAAPWTAADTGGNETLESSGREEPDDPEQHTLLLGGGRMPSKSAQAAGKRGILLTRVRGGEQKALSGTVLHLGRSAQNDYCITGNGSIGRKHAMLEKHGNDYFLKDMESVNGTYLNGMRINGGKPCKLKNGDRIRLADEEFIFEQL